LLQGEDDDKLIGVYETREDAEGAIRRLSGCPDFRQFPDGFLITEYEIGEDHWTVLSDSTIERKNE
jgi:hypothetical protein